MDLEKILPASGLPPSGWPQNREERWCAQDNLEDYSRRGGHPIYGEHDIIYRYNSLGYRCADFDADANIRMISIGCSLTFGIGLPQEALFHELFAERLRRELGKTVVNWNLGLPGTSCDYIARMLHMAMPQLNPDIVLILFPQSGRREYVTVQEKLLHFIPNYVSPNLVAREIAGHFEALSSPFDNVLNFYRNYKSLEYLLAESCWLFSFTRLDDTAHTNMKSFVDRTRFVEVAGSIDGDRARDSGHPGPRTQERYFENFWAKFVICGGLERFAPQDK